MPVRLAIAADALSAIETLRRSITELCIADHHSDPDILTPWLANKTEAEFRRWLNDAEIVLAVAEAEDGSIAGVCSTRRSGEILLNYVHPDHRFAGHSDAMLVWLELRLRENATRVVTLTSTITAHRFYSERGYANAGNGLSWLGSVLVAQPMKKQL